MSRDATRPNCEPRYEVVWPLGKSMANPPINPSPPILDFDGKTIGEVWDYVGGGDIWFPIVRERLRQRFPNVKFVEYHVFGNTHGHNEKEVVAALPGLLRQHGCDAVISGMGE